MDYNGRDVDSLKLQHWKYIKRERVGNKWKYYYDSDALKNDVKDKLGYDEKEALDKAHSKYVLAEQNAKNIQESVSKKLMGVGEFDPYTGELILTEAEKEYQDELYKMKGKAFEEAAAAGKKASEAAKAYFDTPLGKLDKAKSSIEGVKNAVKDVIDSIKSKLKSSRYKV